jgi:N-acetylmuramoyl-L-alanine amidase
VAACAALPADGAEPRSDPPADQAGHFQLKTVIIDAGHGGKDTGAVNRWGLEEKQVTLSVALKLRDYLKANAPFQIVLTRENDTYPTLPERARIANRFDPVESVYISIHCNAAPSAAARGAETYVYNNKATDDKARRVAARENRGMDFSLDFILADLRHRAMAPFTDALAGRIQGNLVQSVGLSDRRVRGGPFYVLFYTTMPSVLVELGFITNHEEQSRLRSASYQTRLAEAIGKAVVAFGRDMDAWRLAAVSRANGQ